MPVGLQFDGVGSGGEPEAAGCLILFFTIDSECRISRIPGDKECPVLWLEFDAELSILFRLQCQLATCWQMTGQGETQIVLACRWQLY